MAKGSYNISVSGDSTPKEGDKNESENQECLNNCLRPAFLRSLSLHDRPHSSRVPTTKKLPQSRYRALASTSLEKIPSEARSECRENHTSESSRLNASIEKISQPSSSSAQYQETAPNGVLEPDSWLEDRCTRFSAESEKLLEKTIAILKTVGEDIAQSFANLTRPESIALESVTEVYRNKGRNAKASDAGQEFDVSTESVNDHIYENWQPFVKQSPTNTKVLPTQQCPKITQVHSTQQNFHDQSSEQNPKNSPQETLNFESLLNSNSGNLSMDLDDVRSVEEPIYENWTPSDQKSENDTEVYSTQQSPKNSQFHSPQQKPKSLLASSLEEASKNFESPLSNSKNAKPDSDDAETVEQSHRNPMFSSKISAPDDTTEVKSRFDFYLPSDHEQFVKIIGALQNRCLEYREMIHDIAFSALEELLNCSESSVGQILHLGRQLKSQKMNFRDFKELCRTSVVFGPDSQPIDEKVTEVIQSFYLQLLQEENETFMARVEFGLKMSEVYAKFLKFEMESKKMISVLEKEILYLKKTSVGFKV